MGMYLDAVEDKESKILYNGIPSTVVTWLLEETKKDDVDSTDWVVWRGHTMFRVPLKEYLEKVDHAVMAGIQNGHTVEWDPPAAMTAVRRWTCTRCGDAVLDNRGHLYGGAIDRTCDESMEFWATRR